MILTKFVIFNYSIDPNIFQKEIRMTNPVCTGRFVSLDPVEECFFQSNQAHLESFYKNVSDIIEKKLEGKIDLSEKEFKISVCKELVEHSMEMLEKYVKLNENTLHLKDNIQANVVSIFYNKIGE